MSFAFLKQSVRVIWFVYVVPLVWISQCQRQYRFSLYFCASLMLPLQGCNACDLRSCMPYFVSPAHLGSVPLQTPFSYWLNHRLRISLTHTYAQNWAVRQSKRSCSLPTWQEMRTLKPKKYINLGSIKANKHLLKCLPTFWIVKWNKAQQVVFFSLPHILNLL